MSHLMQLFEAARFPGGVEVHTDGISAAMTLDGPEHGSLRLFSLAPGVILSFNRIYTQVWPLAQTEAANILLLNFCLNGRCEVDLDNGQFAFLSQGVMALGTQQVKEAYRYPSGVYEGVELFLDMDALEREPYCLFLETGIDLAALIRHFQAAQKLYLAQTPAAIPVLYAIPGDHCQGGALHSPIRSQPKSHSTGTGGAVPDWGNQSEELFPWGIWRKSLCLAPGGPDAPSRGTAAGHGSAGGGDRGTGGL